MVKRAKEAGIEVIEAPSSIPSPIATAPREGTQMPRQPPIEILPVQIREDLIVQIAGIPHDLTQAEAAKIARVVMAMVKPEVAER